MIHLNDLYKVNEDRFLLHKTSFDLMPGECLAIRCQEYQSTLLMDLLIGKSLPTGGDMLINNKQPRIDLPDPQVAFIYKNEGLYERLSVSQYLQFFSKLHRYPHPLQDLLLSCGLADVPRLAVAKLTAAQRKRLSLARAMLQRPKVLIIQEPTLDLDTESAVVIHHVLEQLRRQGTCILAFCTLLEDALRLGGEVAIYADGHINPLDTGEPPNPPQVANQAEERFEMHLDKIPAKLEDKIILLNPMEIHYIESIDSQCWLSIGKDKYPCSFTLSDLETRLMPVGFFRCHRSYLVNLQHVREVVTYSRSSFSLILSDTNKTEIPLSRSRLEDLRAIFKL